MSARAAAPPAPVRPVTLATPRVAVALVALALGGFALGWLRHRTGSVLAPIGLHLGTNAVGLVAAGVALAH